MFDLRSLASENSSFSKNVVAAALREMGPEPRSPSDDPAHAGAPALLPAEGHARRPGARG